MLARSVSAGLAVLRRRAGLAVLLYVVNLGLAFVLAWPLYGALRRVVGPTGFGPDLAAGFDLGLWATIVEHLGEVFGLLGLNLLWMVPLYLLWQAAAMVGLIHAVRGLAVRSFWQGVGRYTGRALVLALLFGVALVLAVIIVLAIGIMLSALWPGEAGAFWINFVILPTLFISAFAGLDLMHDYARIALVTEEQPVMQALATGLTWPRTHRTATVLYLAWFVPAALLWLLPTLLDGNLAAASDTAVWLLFILQQLVLLLRAAVTVGWIGSETYLFETLRLREAPLIAEAPAPAEEWPGDIAPA